MIQNPKPSFIVPFPLSQNVWNCFVHNLIKVISRYIHNGYSIQLLKVIRCCYKYCMDTSRSKWTLYVCVIIHMVALVSTKSSACSFCSLLINYRLQFLHSHTHTGTLCTKLASYWVFWRKWRKIKGAREKWRSNWCSRDCSGSCLRVCAEYQGLAPIVLRRGVIY